MLISGIQSNIIIIYNSHTVIKPPMSTTPLTLYVAIAIPLTMFPAVLYPP